MMRFDSTETGWSISEIVADGTACVVGWLPIPPDSSAAQA
jgi:hypothetical protein